MMGRHCTAFVLLIAVALLNGCATKPEIPFDKGANNIKTIGILTPSEPDHGSVVLASSVGQSFGIIGALVDTGMRMSRESKFNTLLGQESFIFQDELLKSLSDKLSSLHPFGSGRVTLLSQSGKWIAKLTSTASRSMPWCQ